MMNHLTTACAIVGLLGIAGCGETASPDSETPTTNTQEVAVDLSAAPSGEYDTDKGHAYIAFSYSHKGYSRPIIRWGDWDATLDWNQDDPAASSVSVVIDAESIDSGVERLDNHFKTDDFFDVENFSEISFESTSISDVVGNTGKLTGDLTILDQTHPVTLDVMFNKAAFDDRKNSNIIGFSAKTTVSRSQWGLSYGVPVISDEVEIAVEVEFIKPADE